MTSTRASLESASSIFSAISSEMEWMYIGGRPASSTACRNSVLSVSIRFFSVLRNEWGFKNMVMSDWDSMKCKPGEPESPLTGNVQIAQANQMDLVCPGRDDQKVAVLNGLKNGKVKRSDLERSATRILRMIRANTEVPMRV